MSDTFTHSKTTICFLTQSVHSQMYKSNIKELCTGKHQTTVNLHCKELIYSEQSHLQDLTLHSRNNEQKQLN